MHDDDDGPGEHAGPDFVHAIDRALFGAAAQERRRRYDRQARGREAARTHENTPLGGNMDTTQDARLAAAPVRDLTDAEVIEAQARGLLADRLYEAERRRRGSGSLPPLEPDDESEIR